MTALTADTAPRRCTVDYGAAFVAGIVAAAVTLPLLLFFVPAAVGAGDALAVARYLASLTLGPDVLAPAAPFGVAGTVAAVVVHTAVALIMTTVIAFVVHRWGLITGVLGGALLGLAFYAVNFFTLTTVVPHLYAMAHWSVATVHLVFGAIAGGVYELLERDPPGCDGRG